MNGMYLSREFFI